MNPGSDPDVAGSNPGADATREFLFIWHGAVVRASDSEADGLSSARIELFIMMMIVVAGSNPGSDLVGFTSRRGSGSGGRGFESRSGDPHSTTRSSHI